MTEVCQVLHRQRDVIQDGHLVCFTVVDIQEDWISERSKLETIELICHVDIRRIVRIQWHAEAIELDVKLSSPLIST